MTLKPLQTKWTLLCAVFSAASAENEGVIPGAQFPSSPTDTEQENTNADLQSALTARILTDEENVNNVCLSNSTILFSSH